MTQDTSPDTTTAPALPLAPGHWALDPLYSTVGFTVRHLGIAKVRGRFADARADLYIGETAAEVTVTAEIALASIDTGNTDRDAHTRGAGLLDVERRPTMTFRSTRIFGEGANWAMEGDVTIGDVTRPVTFAVEFGGVVDSPVDRRKHAGFEARGEIRRGDFGLDFGAGLLGDVVKVQLDMQFVAPQGQGH
ncbi:YceI family protein [Streptomyces colonosanans]|uniref:Lipid/polyisoprenoid-binding YceI-like domain-containing protein n=1 Tax=Streptomyces colonosanans TaxID=1428652 RepID=A0A1S2P6H2_9ACTN|nr:YceI family protein [Streptomyces colonosanans]OIJ89122.1 hypothetical protein BIV24_20895 [Streptomyces colonosanans]